MILLLGSLLIGCSNNQTIEGTVLDIWNNPISGAMVKMKGSSETQQSDSSGNFSFELQESTEGPLSFRAGHESFIHDVEVVNYSADDETLSPIRFSLYPRPSDAGFYALQSSALEVLEGQRTTLIATKLEAHQGIKSVGSVSVGADKQAFLFHSSLRKEEIQQLNLALNKLTFQAQEQVKGIMGETPIELNLWKISGTSIEFTLRSLDQEHMFLMEFPKPLTKGVYAFHSEGVFNAAEESKLALPKELQQAYPFEVK